MGSIWTYNMDTAFFQRGGNLAMQFTGQRVLQRRLPHQSAGEHVVMFTDTRAEVGRLSDNYMIATMTTGTAIEKCGFVLLKIVIFNEAYDAGAIVN